MSATYPCPICGRLIATRLAPSGSVRLVRHGGRDRADDRSCTGTGWEVIAANPDGPEPG